MIYLAIKEMAIGLDWKWILGPSMVGLLKDLTYCVDRISDFEERVVVIRGHNWTAWGEVCALVELVNAFAHGVSQVILDGLRASVEYKNHETYETLLQLYPTLQTHLERAVGCYDRCDKAYIETARKSVFEVGKSQCEQLQVKIRSWKKRTMMYIIGFALSILLFIACVVCQHVYNGDGIYDYILAAYGLPLRVSQLAVFFLVAILIGLIGYETYCYREYENIEITNNKLKESISLAEKLFKSFNKNVRDIYLPLSTMLDNLRLIDQTENQIQTLHALPSTEPPTEPSTEPPQLVGWAWVWNKVCSWFYNTPPQRPQPHRNVVPAADVQRNRMIENLTRTMDAQVDSYFRNFRDAIHHPSIQSLTEVRNTVTREHGTMH